MVLLESVQHTFPIHMMKRFFFFSKRRPRQRWVVSKPDHAPRVDVEQGAAGPLTPGAVADAP